MNISRLTLIAGLLLSITPAYAQGYAKDRPMVRTNHLPHTEFFHYRPFVSIEENSPIVTDHRRTPQSQPLVVPIPPMPAAGQGAGATVPPNAVPAGDGIFVVPAPAGSGVASSNPMLGDRQYLQDAGPKSYYNPVPITVRRNLPSGVTTGVHGKVATPSHAVAPSGGGINFTKPTANMAGEPIPISKYKDENQSVGSKSTSRSSASLTGRLLDQVK